MFNFIVGVDIYGHAVYEPTPLPSETEVAAFEQRIGQRLPEDYRQFLLTVSGGRVDPREADYACFPIAWSSEHDEAFARSYGNVAMLGDMYFLKPQSAAPLLGMTEEQLASAGLFRNYEGAVVEECVPPDTIPIGNDGGLNQILLGISGENRGKVFYWLADEGSWGKNEDNFVPPSYANVAFVANSFNEFLESLHECDFGQSA